MPGKNKSRIININISPNAFNLIFKRFVGEKNDYEFSGLEDLRKILSNEKAKILYSIKYSKPDSIYSLAKMLKRDFKSVQQDVKLLEKFGFISLIKNTKNNRDRLKPSLAINSLQVIFNI
jgi:predicted transcriptional regulator